MAGNEIRLAAFDFDGTLADNSEGIMRSCEYAARAMGIEPVSREIMRSFIGPPLYDSFRRAYGLTDEQAKEMVVHYRERYSVTGYGECRIYDGIPELLKELRGAGIMTAVATGKPLEYIEKIVAKFSLGSLFDAVCGFGFTRHGADKSDIIIEAAQKCGITDMSQVMMVGDRESDITSARAAGARCIGVTYGFGTETELIGADFIAASPEEAGRIMNC